MKWIKLNKIEVLSNKIHYIFSVSTNLKRYFSGNNFIIEYPRDISSVPKAVLAVPFVCNVLPVIWLENAELQISELDADFYNSIPEFKKGYINMYPDAEFKGKLIVDNIVECRKLNQNGVGTLFSGGLDATTTFLRHLNEKPDLISIWGSDITFDNIKGWKPVQNAIDEVAVRYDVDHFNIRSSFREFDKEWELEKTYKNELHDGWWHGVKHGIGLLGHAAPIIWIQGIKTLYIASTYSPADGKVTCASDPTIDNYVRFCGCQVMHDGFELGRQGKAKYLVSYHKANPEKNIKLHVCWESKNGGNCCHCEKCYRTMAAIWIEGDDPKEYGFEYSSDVLKNMKKKMMLECNYLPYIKKEWIRIQQEMSKNLNMLKMKPYYDDIKWIKSFKFDEPEKNWVRKWYGFRKAKGIRAKMANFVFYQKLHRLKERVK